MSDTQFGFPTLLETNGIEDCAVLCQRLGLSFIEISMDLPEYQPEKLDVTLFNSIANQYGIYYTIHLSGFLNPCDFNERVAAAYIDTTLDTIAIAKQLEVPILSMHLADGDRFTLPNQSVYLYDRYAEHHEQKLVEFRDICTQAIGNADIKLCVENANAENRTEFWARAVDILTKSPVFGITFDIGHNASAGFSAEPHILKQLDRLNHFHVHDAIGTSNHLTLGTGELDIEHYLNLAKTTKSRVVIETKTIDALQQSEEWLKARKWI
jgi:sugar phosphate isomerase/epimerase